MNTIHHISGCARNKVYQTLRASRGFTLIEVMVSVSIVSIVAAMFAGGLFQVLSVQRFWTDDIQATRTVRHAGSWFAGDALNATDVLDAGGVVRLTCTPIPAVQQITLTWTDVSGAPHNVVYSVTGDEFLRDFDSNGTPLRMTDRVVLNSLSFTLCGNTLRATMEVLADRGTTDSLDLMTYLRKLN